MIGRKKPYTSKGISRVKCFRCGQQAERQWQCCAIDNRWLALCVPCDLLLNRRFLEMMGLLTFEINNLMRRYKETLRKL